MANFRGIEEKQESSARKMARDTRTLGERFSDFLSDPFNMTVVMVTTSASYIAFPFLADAVFLVTTMLILFSISKVYTLPFKLPQTSQVADYNDCIPGTNKAKMAKGITFFGNEHVTNKELWFTNEDMRTHVLIFGSTGSGKTETLVSLAYNSLVQGSGFIYIDGKGDNSLFAKVFSMCRFMGRDDDLLIINFMTGARDIIGPQKTRLSNTMNPFSQGSSSMLAELVTSMMDSGSNSGDGDMWKGRAISFVQALLKILVAMRDEGHLLLDAHTVRQYFLLEKLEDIVVDKSFPLDNASPISITNLPDTVLQPLEMYMDNLPGYNRAKKGNQAGEVREQHGFITMQLTRIFSTLADTYGHIIRTNLPEIDFRDIVINRRVLVVLLPALEKSPDELSNLGKVIVASIKAMMASGLGEDVEGTVQEVIERKPTNSPTPYVCILDEYGYYAVKGFAVVPAQARSLGFSAIFAGQDLPAFQKLSKEEAASIGANTNIKICMKLEDPMETWDFFNKVASEAFVTNVREFSINAGSISNNYMDTKSASVDKRARIDFLDLRDQSMGDMHIFFKSRIVRARSFFANPKISKRLQVNQFLCVERPTEEKLVGLDNSLRCFSKVLQDEDYSIEVGEVSEELYSVKTGLDEPAKNAEEQAISGILQLIAEEVKQQEKLQSRAQLENAKVFDGTFDLFSPVPLLEVSEPMIPKLDHKSFQRPLVQKTKTVDSLQKLEIMLGASEMSAQAKIEQLIFNIELETKYPPQIESFEHSRENITALIEKLMKEFSD